MAKRMFLDKETQKVQNYDESFSIKPFYDTDHFDSYIQPTYFEMNATSTCLKDGLEVVPTNHCPSEFRNEDRFFEITLAKCYATYLCTLRLPHRVGAVLPSSDVIATFICNGKSHDIKFFGQRKIKMFGSGWRQFVEEHNLTEGDRLTFKVIESGDGKLVLKVGIPKCRASNGRAVVLNA